MNNSTKSNQSYHLITTADERTWKFDRPVVFLGEWCRHYGQRHLWPTMDAVVAEPYGLDILQKDRDEEEVRRLEGIIFPRLCNVLNEHHRLAHGPRFWKILLGHWMRTYMSTVFNRVKTIEACFGQFNITSTSVVSAFDYGLAPTDSFAAVLAANDDVWNQALYRRIIYGFAHNDIAIERLPVQAEIAFKQAHLAPVEGFSRKILRSIRHLVARIARALSRDTDAFILNSYLPAIGEFNLQIGLGQVPQFWRPQPFETTHNQNIDLRRGLASRLKSNSNDGVERFLHDLVFELLPICYLEGFSELSRVANDLNWPKNPKLIFTSNNFDSDEVFKIWTANKVEAGVRYIAGQHGGNYGSRRIPRRTVEEETSDRFITWGWTDGLPQHIPGFLLRTSGDARSKWKPDSGGRLVVINECLNYRIPVWDDVAEFSQRWRDQLTFVDAIRSDLRSQVIIRLHSQFRNMSWSELDRIRDFDPELAVDTGQTPLDKLLSTSRLIVITYNSSGFYEALSQNIPVIGFWKNGLDSLRESAKPFFLKLTEVGIFHPTPESAAKKVNEVFDRVSDWWVLPELQLARKQFCNQYAKTTSTPIADLKKILIGDQGTMNA